MAAPVEFRIMTFLVTLFYVVPVSVVISSLGLNFNPTNQNTKQPKNHSTKIPTTFSPIRAKSQAKMHKQLHYFNSNIEK